MAIIHRTTLVPGKLEVVAGWLPGQPWYRDRGRAPELVKAGGFRLDDPLGEVGIEFMVATDGSGDEAVSYLVPMTYRASALAGAEDGLMGTAKHGVLGRRWFYDGLRDPVLVTQLVALIQGEAEPQAQSKSSTPDPTVTGVPVASGTLTVRDTGIADDSTAGTDVRVGVAETDGSWSGQLFIRVSRVLVAEGAADGAASGQDGAPCLFADWQLPDGTPARGSFAAARLTIL